MIGIGSSISMGIASAATAGPSFDPDAQAFFNRVTAAGGTLTTTEKNAINQLVLDMKLNGIWSAMKAVYPMVGASAAACAQNLVSSNFTGTFSSGWTFASTGVTPNGTSSYMDSTLIPNGNIGLTSVSIGLFQPNNSGETKAPMGVDQYPINTILLYPRTNVNNFSAYLNSVSVNNFGTFTNTRIFSQISRLNSTTVKGYMNGIEISSSSNISSSLNTNPILIGANSYNGSLRDFSSKQISFAYIGLGLNTTQAQNYNTIVNTFQTLLSR